MTKPKPRDPLERPHRWRCDNCEHVMEWRVRPLHCPQCISPSYSPLNACDDHERELIALRAKAPLQSKGKPVADPGHLPLFIAANEPGLL